MHWLVILQWLLAQPVSAYDVDELPSARRERLEVLAHAISQAALGDRTVAAFLAVQAHAESGLRRDVALCQCPTHQCDGGLAHGTWQIQPVPRQPELWPLVCGLDLDSQLTAARWIARFPRHAPSLEEAFRRLGGAGTRPDAPFIAKRAALVRKWVGRAL